MRSWLTLTVLAALLVGCQTMPRGGNENAPYYVVPAGSRLTLHQALPVQPDSLRVYIQNGRVLKNAEVQHYYPFCSLELDRLSDVARTVAPDEFLITKAVHEEFSGAIADAGPLLYARASLGRRVDQGGNPGGPLMVSFSTRMELRSEKQPDVRRITCAQWGYQGIDRHATVAEIRKTLEPLFTLRLPNQ